MEFLNVPTVFTKQTPTSCPSFKLSPNKVLTASATHYDLIISYTIQTSSVFSVQFTRAYSTNSSKVNMMSPTQKMVTSLLTTLFVLEIGVVSSLSTTGKTPSTAALTKTIQNLNAIVSHIQNPELYSPTWANQIEFHEDTNEPIAKCDINAGELITLFPIQSISIGKAFGSEETTISSEAGDILSKRVDLLEEERYVYPHLRVASEPLYIHASKDIVCDGWYGNLIPFYTTNDNEYETSIYSNCRFVPLPNVAPLCGMVATKSIAKGEIIVQSSPFSSTDPQEEEELYSLSNEIAKEYAYELGDLLPYLQMAYAHIPTATIERSDKVIKKQKYHAINKAYPELKKIHSSPDIYTVKDFLNQDECERIIRKAQLNIKPCLVKNEDTGAVGVDPSRTSTNANIPRREVPSITRKILELGNCMEEQLETFQVLNYKKGQEFKPHTDGFDGPTTACGFQDSGRIATMFCYLNDVPSGGTTMFTKVGLDIEPKRGMAVVHFPMSLDLVEDEMTEHQGSVAMDEKWILTTWIWKHWLSDYRYSDASIQGLNDDII